MNSIGPGIITVVVGVIGLAMVAVIMSRNAQTPQVLQAGGSALSAIIGAAVAPVASNSSLFGSIGANTSGVAMPQLTGGF